MKYAALVSSSGSPLLCSRSQQPYEGACSKETNRLLTVDAARLLPYLPAARFSPPPDTPRHDPNTPRHAPDTPQTRPDTPRHAGDTAQNWPNAHICRRPNVGKKYPSRMLQTNLRVQVPILTVLYFVGRESKTIFYAGLYVWGPSSY